MLRNPYFQLICAIFRVINALRNRNDSFDCHALTSQSKVSSHMYSIWVGLYACTGNRKYDPYTCIVPRTPGRARASPARALVGGALKRDRPKTKVFVCLSVCR